MDDFEHRKIARQWARRIEDIPKGCYDETVIFAVFAASLMHTDRSSSANKTFFEAQMMHHFLASNSPNALSWVLEMNELALKTKPSHFIKRSQIIKAMVNISLLEDEELPPAVFDAILYRIKSNWPDLLRQFLAQFRHKWFKEIGFQDSARFFVKLIPTSLPQITPVHSQSTTIMMVDEPECALLGFVVAGALVRAGMPFACTSVHEISSEEPISAIESAEGSSTRYVITREWNSKKNQHRKVRDYNAKLGSIAGRAASGKIKREYPGGTILIAIPTVQEDGCELSLAIDFALLRDELLALTTPAAEAAIRLLVLDQGSNHPLRVPELSELVLEWCVAAMELFHEAKYRELYKCIAARYIQRLVDPIERLYPRSELTPMEMKGLALTTIPFLRSLFRVIADTLVLSMNHARLSNMCIWLSSLLKYVQPVACERIVREIGGFKFTSRLVSALSSPWDDVRNTCAAFIEKVVGWEGACQALIYDDGRYKFVGELSCYESFNAGDILKWIDDDLLDSVKLRDEEVGLTLYRCLLQHLVKGDIPSATEQAVKEVFPSAYPSESGEEVVCKILRAQVKKASNGKVTSGRLRAIQQHIEVLSHTKLSSDADYLSYITTTMRSELLQPTVQRMIKIVALGENKMLLAKSIADSEGLPDGLNLRVDCRGHVVMIDSPTDSSSPCVADSKGVETHIAHPSSFYTYWTCAKECGTVTATIMRSLPWLSLKDDESFIAYVEAVADDCLTTLLGSRHPGLLDTWSLCLKQIVENSAKAGLDLPARLMQQIGLAVLPSTQLRLSSSVDSQTNLDQLCEDLSLDRLIDWNNKPDERKRIEFFVGGNTMLRVLPPPLRKSASLLATLRAILLEQFVAAKNALPLIKPGSDEVLDSSDIARGLYELLCSIAFLSPDVCMSDAFTPMQQEAIISAKFHATNALRGFCIQQKRWFECAATSICNMQPRAPWVLSVRLMSKAMVSASAIPDFRVQSATNLLFAALQQFVTHCNRLVRIDEEGNVLESRALLLDRAMKGTGNFLMPGCDYITEACHHEDAEFMTDVLEASHELSELVKNIAAGCDISYSFCHLLSLLKPTHLESSTPLCAIFEEIYLNIEGVTSTERSTSVSSTPYSLSHASFCDAESTFLKVLGQLTRSAAATDDAIHQTTVAGIMIAAIPVDLHHAVLVNEWILPLTTCLTKVLSSGVTNSQICFVALLLRGILRRFNVSREVYEEQTQRSFLVCHSHSLKTIEDLHSVCYNMLMGGSNVKQRPAQYIAAVVAEIVWLYLPNESVSVSKEIKASLDGMSKLWLSKMSGDFGLPANVVIRAFIQVPLTRDAQEALRLLHKEPVAIITEGLQVIRTLVCRKQMAMCNPQDVLLLVISHSDVDIIKNGLRCMFEMKTGSIKSTIKVKSENDFGTWSLVSNRRRQSLIPKSDRSSSSRKRCEYLLLHDLMQEFVDSQECNILIIDAVVRLMIRQVQKKKDLSREAGAVVISSINRLCNEYCILGSTDNQVRSMAVDVVIRLLKSIRILQKHDSKLCHKISCILLPILPHLIIDDEIATVRTPMREALLSLVGPSDVYKAITLDNTVAALCVLMETLMGGGSKELSYRTLLAGLAGLTNCSSGAIEIPPLAAVHIPNICASLREASASPFNDENREEDAADLLRAMLNLLPPHSKKYCSWDDQTLIKATTIIAEDVRSMSCSDSCNFRTFRKLMSNDLYADISAAQCLDKLLGIPGSTYLIDF